MSFSSVIDSITGAAGDAGEFLEDVQTGAADVQEFAGEIQGTVGDVQAGVEGAEEGARREITRRRLEQQGRGLVDQLAASPVAVAALAAAGVLLFLRR